MQFSTTLRNNQLDQIEATVGASPLLQLFSGAAPANCAAADSGTKLVEIALPSDWMNAADSGSKTKLGAWAGTGLAAAAAGTNIGHFRLKDSSGTVCGIQGSVTITGGGGDMTVDNTNVAFNQAIAVGTFTIDAGNA